MPLRVVVAEDDYLVREALQRLLDTEERIQLVAVYATADDLLDAIEDDNPDVVLTDIRMPPDGLDEGIVLAEKLRATKPEIGVVVMSNYAEPRHAMRLFEAGAEGRAYLLKQRVASPDALVDAIVDVAAGGSAVDPSVVDRLLNELRTVETPIDRLTPRELEVLALVAQGDSNDRIATTLALSKSAVEKHINGIFAKLGLADEVGVSRRVKATLLYLGRDSGAHAGGIARSG